LIEENRLEGVIALPHWIFKPYASVATAILLFGKAGQTQRVWFYKLENDGFSSDASKTPVYGSEIPDLLTLWANRNADDYTPKIGKHRFVTREEIVEHDYDLCHRVYLSGYEYPEKVPLRHIGELFDVVKGNAGAAQAEDGPFKFITSAEDPKSHSSYSFDTEAICIPTVSSTGHGHASINTIHYVKGKFEAATITAVLIPKSASKVHVPYVYYYLLAHKDQLLVPLMRGAANVTLGIDRLARLRIPVPHDLAEQKALVGPLEHARERVLRCASELKAAQHDSDARLLAFRNQL
jgi:type I restriction enzyme M protein